MLTVAAELDRVVLAFDRRGRDLCLDPGRAFAIADAIDAAAGHAEQWTQSGGRRMVLTGEPVEVRVQSWDGKVNVRFSRAVERIPIPVEDEDGRNPARLLADRIRSKVTEARFRVHLAVNPVAYNSGVH